MARRPAQGCRTSANNQERVVDRESHLRNPSGSDPRHYERYSEFPQSKKPLTPVPKTGIMNQAYIFISHGTLGQVKSFPLHRVLKVLGLLLAIGP